MNPLIYARFAIVAALLGAGFYAGYRWSDSRLGDLQAEISRLQAMEVIYEQANSQCKASVTEANQATDRLLAAGKANAARSKEALAAAQKDSAAAYTTIATIRATAAPADTSCQAQSDAARNVLVDEVKRRITAP